jgi:hypothetical protein
MLPWLGLLNLLLAYLLFTICTKKCTHSKKNSNISSSAVIFNRIQYVPNIAFCSSLKNA